MIWEFHEKSESYESARWKPAPSLVLPDPGTPPLDSDYGAWSFNGDLVVVELKNGDWLHWNKGTREYTFERNKKKAPIDGNYLPVHSLSRIQVRFHWRGEQLGMDLAGEHDDALTTLARKTSSKKIVVELKGVSVVFTPDARRRWTASVNWNPEEPLPAKIGLASVGGNLAAPVSWKWSARSARLIDQDENSLDVRQLSRNQGKSVRIVLNHPAPPGLMLGRRWHLIPIHENVSGEYVVAIKDGEREITCQEFLGVLGEASPLFTAAGFEPDIDTTAWNANEQRCFAILNHQGLPETKQKTTDGTISFGPPKPYVIGSGESTNRVYAWNETRYVIYPKPIFNSGLLPPSSLSASNFPELILFIRQDMAEKVIAGMFRIAVDVAKGRWACRRHLEIGPNIVSWNGFVDEVNVSTINWNGAPRAIAMFKSGFDLPPKLWFTAPFLGIATTEESNWWANASDSKGAKLARRGSRFKQFVRPEQWAVDGRWVEITLGDSTKGAAFDRFGEFLQPATTNLMLFSGDNSSEYSGPVLEVKPDQKWPRVVGWLASVSGDVQMSFGHLKLGSDGKDRIELKADEIPETKDTSERIRNAFREARKSHAPEGEVEGVYWLREGGTIWAQELESIVAGIYVHENLG